MKRRTIWLVLLSLAAFAVVPFQLETYVTQPEKDDPTSFQNVLTHIVLLDDWIRWTLRAALGALTIYLVLRSFKDATAERLGCLGAPATLILAVWLDFPAVLMPWQVFDVVRVPDGRRFAFLYSGLLQGRRCALGIEEPAGFGHRSFRITGIEGDMSIPVFLPARLRIESERFLLGGTNILVGRWDSNRAAFGYDLASDRFIRRDKIDSRALIGTVGEHP